MFAQIFRNGCFCVRKKNVCSNANKRRSFILKWVLRKTSYEEQLILVKLCSAQLYYLQMIQGWVIYWRRKNSHNSYEELPSSWVGCSTLFSSWTIIDKTVANPITGPKTQITRGQLGFFDNFLVTKLGNSLGKWKTFATVLIIVFSPLFL